MNAKNYLKQAFYLNENINDSLQDLEVLREKAISIGAVDVSKDKIQTGRISDIVGDSVPAIVDLDAEINRKIDEYARKKREIEGTIEKVVDCKVRTVLLKRYIHFHEWEDIADSLGCVVSRVFQIHKIGLIEIGKFIVNYSNL